MVVRSALYYQHFKNDFKEGGTDQLVQQITRSMQDTATFSLSIDKIVAALNQMNNPVVERNNKLSKTTLYRR